MNCKMVNVIGKEYKKRMNIFKTINFTIITKMKSRN